MKIRHFDENTRAVEIGGQIELVIETKGRDGTGGVRWEEVDRLRPSGSKNIRIPRHVFLQLYNVWIQSHESASAAASTVGKFNGDEAEAEQVEIYDTPPAAADLFVRRLKKPSNEDTTTAPPLGPLDETDNRRKTPK